ncbi:unnamed protein product [Prorocentrum cordatum]|uniref:Rab3 GTPase-activating protein catalytic subunit n=1 Tax=Prorocentrum cordatum TaxID=2364126 RepID=A0ABN9T5W7_9DINO|nr:unnamed protein product [Polarella glacialis]
MAYLSFNDSFNSNLKFTTDNAEENEEMLKKDLPLRYSWSIWEQIMQSNDKGSAYSDATHKVASFSTVQSFWKLWNHMPQPSELLEQKRMVREQPDGLHSACHRRHHDLPRKHPPRVGGQDERERWPLSVAAEAVHRRRADRRVLEQPRARHDRLHH